MSSRDERSCLLTTSTTPGSRWAGASPPRLADEAGGVGLCVGDEHELVGAVEGGAGGGRVEAGAAVEHERADVVCETFEKVR